MWMACFVCPTFLPPYPHNQYTYQYTYMHSGPRIELGAEHGCVFVDKYVEGDIAVRAQRVSPTSEATGGPLPM